MIHREDQGEVAVLRMEDGKVQALDLELVEGLDVRRRGRGRRLGAGPLPGPGPAPRRRRADPDAGRRARGAGVLFIRVPPGMAPEVVGNGTAHKTQVQEMIRALLGLDELPAEDASRSVRSGPAVAPRQRCTRSGTLRRSGAAPCAAAGATLRSWGCACALTKGRSPMPSTTPWSASCGRRPA